MKRIPIIHNKKGSIMIIALITLLILTIIGISAINNTCVELKIVRNERLNKMVFFAAESARAYATAHGCLYGSQNIDVNTPICFPNSKKTDERFTLGTDLLSFNGTVRFGTPENINGTLKYVISGITKVTPRGSGFEYGQFRQLRYVMTCIGYGHDNSQKKIEQGFCRIGL